MYDNILVIRYGTIGDCVFASAFYRELRKNFPNSRIDILVDKISKGFMKNCPYINNIIDVKRTRRKYLDTFHYLPIFKQYDTVFFLKHDGTFSNIAFMAKIKNRIGFDVKKNNFLTIKVPYDENKHEIDCYLDQLRVLGLKISDENLEVWTNEEDERKVQKKLANIANKKVLIQAFSRCKEKNWIDEYWVELIKYLSNDLRMQVIYSGAQKDKKNYAKIAEILSGAEIHICPIDLSGKLTISETIALIKKVDLIISIDSCGIHIAAALDIPSILIHGNTSLVRWRPRSEKCAIASKYYKCSPCALQTGAKKKKQCEKIPVCMQKLLPEDVIKKIPKDLKRKK